MYIPENMDLTFFNQIAFPNEENKGFCFLSPVKQQVKKNQSVKRLIFLCLKSHNRPYSLRQLYSHHGETIKKEERNVKHVKNQRN